MAKVEPEKIEDYNDYESCESFSSSNSNEDSDYVNFDKYSATPPRTRVLQKFKERRRRSKENSGCMSKSSITSKTRANHSRDRSKKLSRSMSASQFTCDEIDSDLNDSKEKRASNKRLIKLLRNSERALKLDIEITKSLKPEHCKVLDGNNYKPIVEGCKRFMSLSSKKIETTKKKSDETSKRELNRSISEVSYLDNRCPQSRVDFHQTLSLLIRMGCGEKQGQNRHPRRNVSREEVLWQNELKDIIWLELQAWHADRTPTEQDEYLCAARESVQELLNEIMNYKFKRPVSSSVSSIQSSDSGISQESCNGCINIYCNVCLEVQNEAVRDVECLLNRLEAAESLFPSSKAFGDHYPLYNDPELTGRIRAMCLWYNTLKHLRLMLLIIGKLFTMVDTKIEWASAFQDDSGMESGSTNDSHGSMCSDIFSYNIMDFVSVLTIGNNKVSPYRKYIENVLKTRGLDKSLNFLGTLYKFVLAKAKETLEKPEDGTIFDKMVFEKQEDELKRYGIWSPEAQYLSLPSYKSIFLFLSLLPLNMLQEFLTMRIEQKPNNPSPLSLRHLIREYKAILQKAILHRKMFVQYSEIALINCENSRHCYDNKVANLDVKITECFDLYLNYLEQWVLLEHETFPKSFLEEEWFFSRQLAEVVPDGKNITERKFMSMLSSLMKGLSERFMNRIEELTVEIRRNDDEKSRKHILSAICHSVQSVINEEREKCGKMIAFVKNLGRLNLIQLENEDSHKKCLSEALVSLKCIIPKVIEKIESILFTISLDKFDDIEKYSFAVRSREILQQVYRFGFELYKELSDLIVEEYREKLAKSMVYFAFMWMKFATEKCERGRGMRPRWSYQGLEFLLIVCDPKNTIFLSEYEFEELKNRMDQCISHIIGSAAVGNEKLSPKVTFDFSRSLPRSRGSSPNPRTTYKSQRSNSKKNSISNQSALLSLTYNPEINRRASIEKQENLKEICKAQRHFNITKQDRIREAVDRLDQHLEESLREQNLIGRVISVCINPMLKNTTHRKFVNFSWQRGIKIGQGRFGKVYTAVNNTTGELMAVKEIALQQNDNYTINRAAFEMDILEGFSHKNLVKYYGLEVHKGEMLIFMEYCEEGSLENLIIGSENGLPELLVRKFTYQILSGLSELHSRGIVHRDIKSANIFLTDKGNCLKIGDFGCAAKIRTQVTVHGELQGFVGTQAYMAPEIFMKSNTEGYGRAADIWSVGCVVIEMASGKKPWSEYNHGFQIMYKVGSGERPKYPDNFIDEGVDFLNCCLQHDPKERNSVFELLQHHFVKVEDDLA